MELKPKQIEMPVRRNEAQRKNTVYNRPKNVEPVRHSYEKANVDSKQDPCTISDIMSHVFGIVFWTLFGMAFLYFFIMADMNSATPVLQSAKEDKLLAVVLLVFCFVILFGLSSSIVSVISAVVHYIKYKKQERYLSPSQKAILQSSEHTEEDDDENDEYMGIIVNGRKLTPQEAIDFVKKAKKIINVIGVVMAILFGLSAISVGNIFSGIVTLGILFFVRKYIFNLLDKAEAESIKQKIQNKEEYIKEESQKNDPEELKKGLHFVDVFIAILLIICFSQGAISVGIFALFLFFIRKQIVKQIKEAESQSSNEKAEQKEK